VRIGEGSPFAGRRLAEIGLRGRTGATVIAISRGSEVVLVPDGHEILRAGDVLALAGTSAAIEAAREALAHGEASPAWSPVPLEPPERG
jgi:CPA2 family monovalent cation:H+ antiporter-2